jgi:hypothetical protein
MKTLTILPLVLLMTGCAPGINYVNPDFVNYCNKTLDNEDHLMMYHNSGYNPCGSWSISRFTIESDKQDKIKEAKRVKDEEERNATIVIDNVAFDKKRYDNLVKVGEECMKLNTTEFKLNDGSTAWYNGHVLGAPNISGTRMTPTIMDKMLKEVEEDQATGNNGCDYEEGTYAEAKARQQHTMRLIGRVQASMPCNNVTVYSGVNRGHTYNGNIGLNKSCGSVRVK